MSLGKDTFFYAAKRMIQIPALNPGKLMYFCLQ
jgi:hypothetical protein